MRRNIDGKDSTLLFHNGLRRIFELNQHAWSSFLIKDLRVIDVSRTKKKKKKEKENTLAASVKNRLIFFYHI